MIPVTKKIIPITNMIVKNNIEIITEENSFVHVSGHLIGMTLKICIIGSNLNVLFLFTESIDI